MLTNDIVNIEQLVPGGHNQDKFLERKSDSALH